MDPVLDAVQRLSSAVSGERCRSASDLSAALRDRPLDGTPAVGALGRALHDPVIEVARQAADVLRVIAQYRRGSIAEAVEELARVVTSEDQELRKRAGEALVEGAENGPGIARAVPALEAALTHPMKHVRALATSALAAHLVDVQDGAGLERLIEGHPRADVRERALGYVRRGAEWKDISFTVPLLCRLVRGDDPRARRRSAEALVAYLRGPKGVRIPPARLKECAGGIVRSLEGREADDLPELQELREGALRAIRSAVSLEELPGLVAELAAGDAGRRAEAAFTLQLAANAGVDIESAVPALRALTGDPEAGGGSGALWALVAHHVNGADWARLRELLLHDNPRVREEVLARLDIEAIVTPTSFTPLVEAVSALLKDADAGVRAAAANLLQSFAMFGNAADRTDLGAAAQPLATAANRGEPDVSETAGHALQFGQAFGGLASASRASGGSAPHAERSTERCMRGSPRDPTTGEYLCGKC